MFFEKINVTNKILRTGGIVLYVTEFLLSLDVSARVLLCPLSNEDMSSKKISKGFSSSNADSRAEADLKQEISKISSCLFAEYFFM